MKPFFLTAIAFAASILMLFPNTLSAQITCELYTFNKSKIEAQKQQLLQSATRPNALSVKKLLHEADKALADSVYSVVYKSQLPPDADKHNYMSLARYFWPDSSNAKGPYVRKDGENNPEIKEYPDEQALNKMSRSVQYLALAYYFTGNQAYAQKAQQLLQAWFVDARTRMNPNMNYAQAVKGKNNGKPSGVLETRPFIPLLDMVELLYNQKALDAVTYKALQAWFSSYINWLDTSKNGKGEQNAANNHGTWCAAQYARYALFVGQKTEARIKLEALKKRIATQIEPDGRQPLELARTKSLSYSCFNLQAYCTAALMAEKLGVDLWTYQTPDGRSIKKAIDYILPYAMQPETYQGQQIVKFQLKEISLILRCSAAHYPDNKQYQLWLSQLNEKEADSVDKLWH